MKRLPKKRSLVATPLLFAAAVGAAAAAAAGDAAAPPGEALFSEQRNVARRLRGLLEDALNDLEEVRGVLREEPRVVQWAMHAQEREEGAALAPGIRDAGRSGEERVVFSTRPHEVLPQSWAGATVWESKPHRAHLGKHRHRERRERVARLRQALRRARDRRQPSNVMALVHPEEESAAGTLKGPQRHRHRESHVADSSAAGRVPTSAAVVVGGVRAGGEATSKAEAAKHAQAQSQTESRRKRVERLKEQVEAILKSMADREDRENAARSRAEAEKAAAQAAYAEATRAQAHDGVIAGDLARKSADASSRTHTADDRGTSVSSARAVGTRGVPMKQAAKKVVGTEELRRPAARGEHSVKTVVTAGRATHPDQVSVKHLASASARVSERTRTPDVERGAAPSQKPVETAGRRVQVPHVELFPARKQPAAAGAGMRGKAETSVVEKAHARVIAGDLARKSAHASSREHRAVDNAPAVGTKGATVKQAAKKVMGTEEVKRPAAGRAARAGKAASEHLASDIARGSRRTRIAEVEHGAPHGRTSVETGSRGVDLEHVTVLGRSADAGAGVSGKAENVVVEKARVGAAIAGDLARMNADASKRNRTTDEQGASVHGAHAAGAEGAPMEQAASNVTGADEAERPEAAGERSIKTVVTAGRTAQADKASSEHLARASARGSERTRTPEVQQGAPRGQNSVETAGRGVQVPDVEHFTMRKKFAAAGAGVSAKAETAVVEKAPVQGVSRVSDGLPDKVVFDTNDDGTVEDRELVEALSFTFRTHLRRAPGGIKASDDEVQDLQMANYLTMLKEQLPGIDRDRDGVVSDAEFRAAAGGGETGAAPATLRRLWAYAVTGGLRKSGA